VIQHTNIPAAQLRFPCGKALLFRKKAKHVAGGNALKIVENAIVFKNSSEKKYDHYWAVFDKDETPDPDFARAIELAETNNIHAA
jgi:hypothetical protein